MQPCKVQNIQKLFFFTVENINQLLINKKKKKFQILSGLVSYKSASTPWSLPLIHLYTNIQSRELNKFYKTLKFIITVLTSHGVWQYKHTDHQHPVQVWCFIPALSTPAAPPWSKFLLFSHLWPFPSALHSSFIHFHNPVKASPTKFSIIPPGSSYVSKKNCIHSHESHGNLVSPLLPLTKLWLSFFKVAL